MTISATIECMKRTAEFDVEAAEDSALVIRPPDTCDMVQLFRQAGAGRAIGGPHLLPPVKVQAQSMQCGDWHAIEIFLPVPGDALYLAAFAKVQGTQLLEWTTDPTEWNRQQETLRQESDRLTTT